MTLTTQLKLRLKGYLDVSVLRNQDFLKSIITLSSMEAPRTHLSAQRPRERTEGRDLAVERTEFWFRYAVNQRAPSRPAGDPHRFLPALLSREGGSCWKKPLFSVWLYSPLIRAVVSYRLNTKLGVSNTLNSTNCPLPILYFSKFSKLSEVDIIIPILQTQRIS